MSRWKFPAYQRAKMLLFGSIGLDCPLVAKGECKRKSKGANDPYSNSTNGLCSVCLRDVELSAKALRKAFGEGRCR